MAFRENLPFPRGQTFFNGATTNATDGANLEGKEYELDDPTYNMGPIKLRIVRNVSGITLQARRLVVFKAGKYSSQVDGYASTTTQKCAPIDDQLGATGTVVNNDLFYIVVAGPCLIRTDTVTLTGTGFVEKDVVVNGTAANSTAAGSTGVGGRIILRDFSAATTLQLQGIVDRVGRAMTARTANNTDTDTLVFCGTLW